MRAATPLDQPRAIGQAFVSSKRRDGRSAIDGLRQSGALKLLFPTRTDFVEAIVINTSGGVTGGDDFRIGVRSGVGSKLMITTQAAERAYRAQKGQTGHIESVLEAEADSTLFWLPQETILYDEAAVHRQLTVDLAPTARFLMVEPILFGRRAMGEDPTHLHFHDRITLRRAGMPFYQDGITLSGDAATQLDRPAVAAGARAAASLVYVDPAAEAKLEAVRGHLDTAGGASMLQDDVLAVRLLAEDGFEMRRRLLPILDLLTENTLPQSWRL